MRVARVDSQQGCAYIRAEARAGDPYEAVFAPQGQRDEGLQMWRSRCNSGRDSEKNRWHPDHHLSGHEGSCESAATHERGHDTTGAKRGRGPVSERVRQHVLVWLPPFSERSGIQPCRALKRVVARPLSYDEEVLPVEAKKGCEPHTRADYWLLTSGRDKTGGLEGPSSESLLLTLRGGRNGLLATVVEKSPYVVVVVEHVACANLHVE